MNTVISIIVSIGTGLITGVVVSAYYDLNNLKQNLLYEIRRINYMHTGDNKFEIINTPTEISSIRENIMLLTSRALCDFNEKGTYIQKLQEKIFLVIDNGQASNMKRRYINWQKQVRGLRLSRTDVTRRLKDITCTNIKTKDLSSKKRPRKVCQGKKVWSQMDIDKKNAIDSINASSNTELSHAIAITAIIVAFAYFSLEKISSLNLINMSDFIPFLAIIFSCIVALIGSMFLIKSRYFSFHKKNIYIQRILSTMSNTEREPFEEYLEVINPCKGIAKITYLILVGLVIFFLLTYARTLYMIGGIEAMQESPFLSFICFSTPLIASIFFYLQESKEIKKDMEHGQYKKNVSITFIIATFLLLIMATIDTFTIS